MSDDVAFRLWLGWRTAQLHSDSGWADFKKSLAETFIPATWEIMEHYKLLTYVPSIFSPSGVEGLPEEVALLCYATKNDYEISKNEVLGRSYRVMHQAIFEFQQDNRVSKAGWCDKVGNEKPYLGPRRKDGKSFNDPDASIHVMSLYSAEQALSPQDVAGVLSALADHVAVWVQHKYAVIWTASSAPLDENQIRAKFAEAIPSSRIVAFHIAGSAPQIDQKVGIPVSDDHSWHFRR